MDDDGKDEDLSLAASMIREKSHQWQGEWKWGQRAVDRGIAELDAVRTTFASAGIRIENLASNPMPNEPPDCSGMIEGASCGIEVTELMDQPTFQKSVKKIKRSGDYRDGFYKIWDATTLINKINAALVKKDIFHRIERDRFERYIVVIVTSEMYIDRILAAAIVDGFVFQSKLITDAYLTLGYQPGSNDSDGHYPTFKLNVVRAPS